MVSSETARRVRVRVVSSATHTWTNGAPRRVAAARAISHRVLPFMQVVFIESNPIPIKAAMAAAGLIEEVYRLPMCPPKPESREKILKVMRDLGLLKAALV